MPNVNMLQPLPIILLGQANTWTGVQTFTSPVIQGTVAAGTGLTMPAFTGGGDISLGANKLKTTNMLFKEDAAEWMALRNAGDTAYKYLNVQGMQAPDFISLNADGADLRTINNDNAAAKFLARDNGVGLVEVSRLANAADPYLQAGRDDTGVALNAVTDMLVLQAGGGTGNEAANFGLGISLKIGNAASQVEERGSLDIVLVTATDGSEDVRLDYNLMAGGAMNLAAQLSGAGIWDVDLSSGLAAATVGLFDDYDDALVLRQGIQQRQIGVLESLGIAHRKDTGSGWMLSLQPFLYLLAGGIYQTRQMVENLLGEKDKQIAALEQRLVKLEGG